MVHCGLRFRRRGVRADPAPAQKLSYQAVPPGTCCTDHFVGVARRGTLLVAVTSLGWELRGGYDGSATYWAAQALNRAEVLRAT